jgi:hypothetical protein
MTLEQWAIEIVRDGILLGVFLAELRLARELVESRKFMEKMQDNILAAMGLSMALNTAINITQAWFTHIQKHTGESVENEKDRE